MHFLVACTIKSVAKNQSGIFRVGRTHQGGRWNFWEKVAGEYDLAVQGKNFTEGIWSEHGSYHFSKDEQTWINPGPENRLMIYTTYEPDLPYTSPREHLATLEKCPVAKIFRLVHLEKQTIRGEGTTVLTNEKLEWSMWYKPNP